MSVGKRTISQFFADIDIPLHVIGTLFKACCSATYNDYENIYVWAMDRGGTRVLCVSDHHIFLHHGSHSQLPG
jgi:hypothetical protein